MTVDPGCGDSPSRERDDAIVRRLESEARSELAVGRSIAPAVRRRIESSPAPAPAPVRLAIPAMVAASLLLVAGIAWRVGWPNAPDAEPMTAIVEEVTGVPPAGRGPTVGRDVGRVLVRLTESAQAPLRREAEATRELGGGLARLFTREVSNKLRLLRGRPSEGGTSI